MKKLIFTTVLLLSATVTTSFAVGQTYHPLEDQRLSTGNDVQFKKLNIAGNVAITPGTVPASGMNTISHALHIQTDYVKAGPANVVYLSTTTSDATAGTYTGIIPTNVSSSGSGLVLQIVVNANTLQSSTPIVTSQGTGYKSGDVLSIPRSALGGPATGNYTVVIGRINTANTFSADNTPVRLTTYLQEAGFVGAFTPFLRASALGRDGSTLNLARMDFGIYWDNINRGTPAILSNGSVSAQFTSSGIVCNTAVIGTVNGTTISTTTVNGNAYNSTNGYYSASGLTNANITFHTAQTKIIGSTSYSSAQQVLSGVPATVTITNAGAGYTPGTYSAVAAIGGSGTGLNLNIVVGATGSVIAATVVPNSASEYTAGNSISANVAGGAGFAATVNLRTNNTFSAYQVTDAFHNNSADAYYGFRGIPTINQNAGATGTICGWYWNPTLTALLGKHNAIHTVTGNVLLATASGNVGIGTTDPGTYRLAVEGTIGARRIKVTAPGIPWADYVFDSSYHLASLPEVERFIQDNKHLPDIPSAAEVNKQGIDLGDNQAVLLRKIEELTLYLIQQDKEKQVLQASLKKQQEVLEIVQQQLNNLLKKQ